MQEMPYHSPHRVLTVAGGHDVETVLPCHGVFDPLGLGWGQDLVSSDSLQQQQQLCSVRSSWYLGESIKLERCVHFEAPS